MEQLSADISSARQYYQDSYGGYVECCEEVVDPLILLGVIAGIGGLTFFLRSQILRFIGRKKRDISESPEDGLIKNIENAQIVLESIASFYGLTDEHFHERGSNMTFRNEVDYTSPDSMQCYVSSGLCLMDSLQVSLRSKDSESDLLWAALKGMAEYLVLKDISGIWPQLSKYQAVQKIVTCVRGFQYCRGP